MALAQVRAAVFSALGAAPLSLTPLPGGCIGAVYRADFAAGPPRVVKFDAGAAPRLDVEGRMLRFLADQSALPVPEVIHAAPDLLIMALLPGGSQFSAGAEAHAADLLAALHRRTAPAFGLAYDTLIGGLQQPNPWTDRWLDFFVEQRLRHMGRAALDSGRLPAALFARLETLCARLDRWLDEPAQPALLHGDVWTTNVLAEGDRITAFVDPAIYYGHPEIELAFITLFGTFGAAFFDRYRSHHALDDGFFEARRDLYNLYPLLVHVRLFGGGYVAGVARTLTRFGC